MFDVLNLAVAILLPWITGIACLARCWQPDAPGRWPAMVGYGYLFGMVGTAALLLATERVMGDWRYGTVVAMLSVVLVLAAMANRHWLRPTAATGVGSWRELSTYARLLVVVLALLLAWRLGGFLLEVMWRPVHAWDSWYFWSYRAKAFFSAGHWIDPVWGAEWLRSSGAGYYGGFRHPPLLSVVQLWPALALGRWDDSLTLLPWWFAGAALLAAVYGQLRAAGLPVPWALAPVYVLVSAPIVGTHYALGGYADVWIMAFTALAAMSLVAAFRGPARRQWVLVALAAVAIAFTKQTGILITAVLIAAVVLAWLPAWLGVAIAIAAAVVVPAWALTMGIDLHIPMLGRVIIDSNQIYIWRAGAIELRPAWTAWFQRLLLDSSWHLLFWLAPVAPIAGLPLARQKPEHRGLLVIVTGVFLIIAGVYLFTRQVGALKDGSGVNRQLMQMAAPIVVWAALIGWDWLARLRPPTEQIQVEK